MVRALSSSLPLYQHSCFFLFFLLPPHISSFPSPHHHRANFFSTSFFSLFCFNTLAVTMISQWNGGNFFFSSSYQARAPQTHTHTREDGWMIRKIAGISFFMFFILLHLILISSRTFSLQKLRLMSNERLFDMNESSVASASVAGVMATKYRFTFEILWGRGCC